ncbi:MAG: radical SAM family heme chaperone HemW [Oscillospiraceae bacterium]|nr:radical SAM family heme chaperone HemW [Oscillospiraceae bacterium]
MNKKSPAGLYIHVPFCIQKCRYCDFYSFPKGEEYFEIYKKRVIEAIDFYGKRYARPYNSLYLGGGTPLLLGEKHLSDIMAAAKPYLTPDAEITAEGNPGVSERCDFFALREAGINRLSFGLQSSDEKELAALGRIHSPKEAEETVKAAQKAGFDNISLDLMLGIPYQTEESLCKSIDFCDSLGVQHISCYMLKIEEGTPLAKSELRFLCADEEKSADFYLLACEELEKRGFEQYEISNFAKGGKRSFHNLRYWLDDEYIGIGPSAHSFMEGRRFYFDRSIKDFLEKPFCENEKEESSGGGWEEYAMLRLRLSDGLDVSELESRFPEVSGADILENAKPFEKPGLLRIKGETVSFTPKGFLLSNALTAEILFG